MSKFTRRILFIAHDAARSGAPMLLLIFLRWLRQNKNDINFDILLLKDGPLRSEFETLASTHVVPGNYRFNIVNKVRVRLHPKLVDQYKISEVVNKLVKNNYGLIYGNTIVSLPWMLEFKRLHNVKLICAVHELTNAITYFFSKDYIIKALPQVDLIIAGSNAVAINLENEFAISDDKISVFHAFIDRNYKIFTKSAQLREDLGITGDELVIGGMSQIELRKGVDMVVPLAVELKDKYPEVRFKMLWVGGNESDNFVQIVRQDAIKCGVSNNVLFINNTPYADDYINMYDIFLLLSREDPFPLVLLSAANMGKGLIAFEQSGGATELLCDGAGFVVPYLKVQALAALIADLFHHPEKIKNAGVIAKRKVEQEFNSEVLPDRIFSVISKFFN